MQAGKSKKFGSLEKGEVKTEDRRERRKEERKAEGGRRKANPAPILPNHFTDLWVLGCDNWGTCLSTLALYGI